MLSRAATLQTKELAKIGLMLMKLSVELLLGLCVVHCTLNLSERCGKIK